MILKIHEYAFKLNETTVHEIRLNEKIDVLVRGGAFDKKPVFKITPLKATENSLEFNIEGKLRKYNFIKQDKSGKRDDYLPVKKRCSLEIGEEISLSLKPPKKRVFDAVHGYKISIENE